MAVTLADIQGKVTALATAVDGLGTKVDGVKTDVEAEIARLDAIIAAGGAPDPAVLQSISDGLDAATAKLGTISTEADTISSEAQAAK